MSKSGIRLPSGPSVRLPSPAPIPTSPLLDVAGASSLAPASLLPTYLILTPAAASIAQSTYFVSYIVPLFVSFGNLVKHYSDGELVRLDRTLVLLVAIHGFMTFVITAITSVIAQAAGPFGYRNKSPRLYTNTLTGFAHRVNAAHLALMENFGYFAVTAALVAVFAPESQLVNEVALYVVLKIFIWYPSYLLDVDPLRTASHMLAMGALNHVLWKLVSM